MGEFTRDEIKMKFLSKIRMKQPIIVGAAGIGLVAKMERIGGIDMISCSLNDFLRMDGQTSATQYLAYQDANTVLLKNGRKILKMTKGIPTIAGVGAGDPYREVENVVEELIDMGFSGIMNSPALGAYGPDMAEEVAGTEIGFNADVDLIRMCSGKDIFTLACAFTPEQAEEFARAGADAVVANVGITVGGLGGAPEDDSMSLSEACEYVQSIYHSIRKIREDTFVMFRGGPFNGLEAVDCCFRTTDAQGFAGESVFDRLPIERAIQSCVEEYKSLRLEAL